MDSRFHGNDNLELLSSVFTKMATAIATMGDDAQPWGRTAVGAHSRAPLQILGDCLKDLLLALVLHLASIRGN